MSHIIKIASAIILDSQNNLLVVRKKNSTFYMLPGGKIENNETKIQTLIRELDEELNLDFKEEQFEFLGSHSTTAANEANTIVEGNIFKLKTTISFENINNQAEIEEVTWLSKESYQNFKLAHLLQEFALPKWLNNFKD